jgi:outer membrane protein TolC
MAEEIAQMVEMIQSLLQAGQAQQQRIDNLETVISKLQQSQQKAELEFEQLRKSIDQAGSQMPDLAGMMPMHAGLPAQPGMPGAIPMVAPVQ